MDFDRRELKRLLNEVNTVGVADQADQPGIQGLIKAYINKYKRDSVKVKLPKLLIERVLMVHRAVASAMQASHNIEWFKAVQLVVALEQAQEFFWKSSGLAMCEAIRAGIDKGAHYHLHIDNASRWMLFEEPIKTPCGDVAGMLCYCRTDKELLAKTVRACRPPGNGLAVFQELLDRYNGQFNTQWALYMYDAIGGVCWHMVLAIDEQGETSWAPDPTFCSDHACYFSGDAQISVCPRCAEAAAFWISWVDTALAMLRGEYRESAEPEEPQYRTETETRVERDEKQTWKTKKVNVRHKMRVVQFDASLAKSKPKNPRGSWLAGRAVGSEEYLDLLDDDAVIYTNIARGPSTRHFRHPRYKAARGTSKQFRATKAFAPVTVRYLKARRAQGEAKPVTVVSASKFDVSDSLGHLEENEGEP